MDDEVHVHQEPPPVSGGGGNSSTGWIVGLLVLIVVVILVWAVFLRDSAGDSGVPDEVNIEITVPGTGG
ncbi:MAG: hypothetical protein WEB88_15575 [Gemmatimonadota bacterium]